MYELQQTAVFDFGGGTRYRERAASATIDNTLAYMTRMSTENILYHATQHEWRAYLDTDVHPTPLPHYP